MSQTATPRPRVPGWPLEITVTYDSLSGTPILRAGKAQYSTFECMPTSKSKMLQTVYIFLDEGFIPYHHSYYDNYGAQLKEKYTWLGDHMGYKFASAWNKIMLREWVMPHKQIADPLCFGRYGIRGSLGYNPKLLVMLWERKELLLQCHKDGIMNIAPFVLHSGLAPKELKEQFGNADWKKITSNSLSRNKIFCNKFGAADRRMSRLMLDVPTTALLKMDSWRNVTYGAVLQEILAAKKERRLGKLTSWDITRLHVVVTDVERMAAQLDEPFNHGWSYRRIERQHTIYQNAVAAKRYGTDRIEYVCGPGSVVGEEFDLVLLDTPLQIAEEGNAQNHCVASYIWDVTKGECSIYSLRDKKGERLTTVQIHSDTRVGQHYGKHNRNPTPEEDQWVRRAVSDWRSKVGLFD